MLPELRIASSDHLGDRAWKSGPALAALVSVVAPRSIVAGLVLSRPSLSLPLRLCYFLPPRLACRRWLRPEGETRSIRSCRRSTTL